MADDAEMSQVSVDTSDFVPAPGPLLHPSEGQGENEVQKIASAIRERLACIRENIFEIGHDLLRAKSMIPHGQWLTWLSSEFGLTARTALNYMNVAERFGDKYESLSDLRLETLYRLAAPSTPGDVVDAVLAQAASSERVMEADVISMLPPLGRERLSGQGGISNGTDINTPRRRPIEDPYNDWTSQAFQLLRAQIKDRARLKTLADLLECADIDTLIAKIKNHLIQHRA
jgi:hypothetical protein